MTYSKYIHLPVLTSMDRHRPKADFGRLVLPDFLTTLQYCQSLKKTKQEAVLLMFSIYSNFKLQIKLFG